MRKLLILSTLFLLSVTNTAQASTKHHHVRCTAQQPLQQLAKCQKRALAHHEGYVRFARRHNAGTYKQLVWHRKAAVWTRKELNQTLGTIYKKSIESQLGDVGAWLCIHRYERGAAGWSTNTGNGYYGGLQMDYSFMSTYGPELLRTKGTADNWTWQEQMMVAERARRSGRGYYPWPNTARECGLI